MSRYYRAGILLVCAITFAVIVSGCSAGPPRDANGRVTEAVLVGSTTMEVGDCFSFEADPSEVSVTLRTARSNSGAPTHASNALT